MELKSSDFVKTLCEHQLKAMLTKVKMANLLGYNCKCLPNPVSTYIGLYPAPWLKTEMFQKTLSLFYGDVMLKFVCFWFLKFLALRAMSNLGHGTFYVIL